MAKDLFSSQAEEYARYRPVYPPAFYTFVLSLVNQKQNAWDCGTGNGQVAVELARIFNRVWATDISQAQLEQAAHQPNIIYSVQPAEKTDFPGNFFDLIVVAQAIHWFDFEKFYNEVNRTLRSGGILAAVGYGRIRITQEIDHVTDDFYLNTVGPYWDKERRYIDECYRTIPFPFAEITAPAMENVSAWTFHQLVGYLGTWSAVKHFIKARGYDPVAEIKPRLMQVWGTAEKREVRFPLLLRVGRK